MSDFKYLVTSALPYVNNELHLGHLISSLLPADVYSRFLKFRGDECIYVCGTDEYGTAIAVEAEKQKMKPLELANKYHEIQKKITEDFNLKLDIFSRTSAPEHTTTTQGIYELIKSNDYIYNKKVKQLYCEKCKRFLPDRYVKGECPHCGYEEARGDQCEKCGKLLEPIELVKPKCVSCRKKPVEKENEHVFFRLSKLSEKLASWVDGNKHWPPNARNFALSWAKAGLEDRDISREMEWGVPIPDFPGNVFYVWFDAPIGYITFSKQIGKEKWWSDSDTRIVHFMGKDNIAFHTIFFPGMLMAAGGFTLPYHVASYEFLDYQGKKFSKSAGVGIFCRDAITLYPADYWRYYLIASLTEHRDADFTWEDFQKRVNNDLNDVLGNFIHRTLTFTRDIFGGAVPKLGRYTEEDEKIVAEIAKKHSEVEQSLDKVKLKDALNSAIDLARAGNQYLTLQEPWKDKERRNNVINLSLNIVAALSIILEPFIPESARKIRKFLNLDENYKWKDAVKLLEPGKTMGEFEPLFKKITNKDVADFKHKFG